MCLRTVWLASSFGETDTGYKSRSQRGMAASTSMPPSGRGVHIGCPSCRRRQRVPAGDHPRGAAHPHRIDFAGRQVHAPTFELGKWVIPQRYSILVSILQLHNRGDVFPDPEAIDPRHYIGNRPPSFAWIPFGGGARRCVGAVPAHVEMDVVLHSVLALRDRHDDRAGREGAFAWGGVRRRTRRRTAAGSPCTTVRLPHESAEAEGVWPSQSLALRGARLAGRTLAPRDATTEPQDPIRSPRPGPRLAHPSLHRPVPMC